MRKQPFIRGHAELAALTEHFFIPFLRAHLTRPRRSLSHADFRLLCSQGVLGVGKHIEEWTLNFDFTFQTRLTYVTKLGWICMIRTHQDN